jgi:hypothetical protein
MCPVIGRIVVFNFTLDGSNIISLGRDISLVYLIDTLLTLIGEIITDFSLFVGISLLNQIEMYV